jgi:ABC-type phosphate transport system substrate-binding protein
VSLVRATALLALVGFVSASWSAGEAAAPTQPLAVVVNKSNPVSDLSFADLRAIFMGRRAKWPNGRRVTIALLDPGQPERDAVLGQIYRMTEPEVTRLFLHATFTGEQLALPRSLANPAGVRRFVFNVPGAIGVVAQSDLDDTVKVVRIDGLALADSGYHLLLRRP